MDPLGARASASECRGTSSPPAAVARARPGPAIRLGACQRQAVKVLVTGDHHGHVTTAGHAGLRVKLPPESRSESDSDPGPGASLSQLGNFNGCTVETNLKVRSIRVRSRAATESA